MNNREFLLYKSFGLFVVSIVLITCVILRYLPPSLPGGEIEKGENSRQQHGLSRSSSHPSVHTRTSGINVLEGCKKLGELNCFLRFCAGLFESYSFSFYSTLRCSLLRIGELGS
jgi:hypothetical protein